jgi:hypothetical protein
VNVSTEAEGTGEENNRLRGLSTCCSKLQSMRISDTAFVTHSYDMKVLNKSNYQPKPHLYSVHTSVTAFFCKILQY